MAKATTGAANKGSVKGKGSKAPKATVKGAVGKGSVKAKGKAGKAKAAPVVRERPLLTQRETKMLTVMAKSKRPVTRGQLIEATDITKGFSAILGSYDDPSAESLVGRSLVAHDRVEGERSIMYSITAKGRQLLERHLKALKAK